MGGPGKGQEETPRQTEELSGAPVLRAAGSICSAWVISEPGGHVFKGSSREKLYSLESESMFLHVSF